MSRAYIVVDHDDHEEELQHAADGLRSREDAFSPSTLNPKP